MSRKSLLVPLLVLCAGCNTNIGPGDDAGHCDGAHVDAAPAATAADTTTLGIADAASDKPGALEAGVGAVASDAAPVADAPVESAAMTPDAADHCTDGKQDLDESDVDCGGSCPSCGLGQVCFVDADCSATAAGCDVDAGGCYCVARALVCAVSHCVDQKKDVDETDLDCGGKSCSPCAVGLGCLVDSDCALSACDAISDKCVFSMCADHRQDGDESDVDCGGSTCNTCLVGQRCNSNFDCQSGHLCQGDAGDRACQ